MLKKYFKIAVRHHIRHKLFSLIHILCLAKKLGLNMNSGYLLFYCTENLKEWISANLSSDPKIFIVNNSSSEYWSCPNAALKDSQIFHHLYH